MEVEVKDPPRKFEARVGAGVFVSDCARIGLSSNELITLTTEQGAEVDVVRKSWGFYVTSSMNSRLRKFGLQTYLVKNNLGKHYVLLAEDGSEKEFRDYLKSEHMIIVCRLDDEETLEKIEKAMESTEK